MSTTLLKLSSIFTAKYFNRVAATEISVKTFVFVYWEKIISKILLLQCLKTYLSKK